MIVFILTNCTAESGKKSTNNQNNYYNNLNNTNNYYNNQNNYYNNFNNSNNSNNHQDAGTDPDGEPIGDIPLEEWLELLCETAPEEPTTYFMSADDSASQAQPMLAKDRILKGNCNQLRHLAPREYEFLNYYTFDYEPAPAGQLAIYPEMMLDEDGQYKLLVGLVSEARTLADRRPVHFVFSLDTSGSMSGLPIENLKHTLRAISVRLRQGDMISLVEWSHVQNVLLSGHMVSGPADPTLSGIIENLGATGSTDLNGGLIRAYEQARQHYSLDRLTRVILISDGGANTGVTSHTLIGEAASMEEGDGIFLIGVGTGDYYNHQLMDTVTDYGRGAYLYINDEATAYESFSEKRFLQNLDIAALNVRLEMTLPPGFVISRFHGEEISTNPEEVRPQHLAPNDAMLFHSFLHYCDDNPVYSQEIVFRATWMDPLTREARSETVTMTVGQLLQGSRCMLNKANAVVNYARFLAGQSIYDEQDRGQQKVLLLSELQGLIDQTSDPELQEILDLTNQCL